MARVSGPKATPAADRRNGLLPLDAAPLGEELFAVVRIRAQKRTTTFEEDGSEIESTVWEVVEVEPLMPLWPETDQVARILSFAREKRTGEQALL